MNSKKDIKKALEKFPNIKKQGRWKEVESFYSKTGQLYKNDDASAEALIDDVKNNWIESRKDLQKLILIALEDAVFSNKKIQSYLIDAFQAMLYGATPQKALHFEGTGSGDYRLIADLQKRYDIALEMFMLCGFIIRSGEKRMKRDEAADIIGKKHKTAPSSVMDYYKEFMPIIKKDCALLIDPKKGS